METNLDKAVSDKKITADKAAQIKAKIPQMIDRMINRNPKKNSDKD